MIQSRKKKSKLYSVFKQKNYLCAPIENPFVFNPKIIKHSPPYRGSKLEFNMAHHASAKKRIRQDAKRRLRNRYYKKSSRSAIQKLREMTDKKEAEKFLPKVISMIDRLAKKNTWHKNKASNLKGKLTRFVAGL